MHGVGTGRGVLPGGVLGGYWEGGIPGTPPSWSTLVLPGPNHSLAQRFCVHPSTPGPCRPLRTLGLLALKYPPQDQYRARFHLNILKLVNIQSVTENSP